ncbi:MAG TPA: hypothetical protein VHN74_00835 [Candidatus Angelobacter sp.]|jgi:hypothetical protein|nr:hypothetical protein [Candidatus Angelobacter sp.]
MFLLSRYRVLVYLLAVLCAAAAFPQSPPAISVPPRPDLPKDATSYIRDIIKNEIDSDAKDHTLWRYRFHREDEKNNYDRDVVETREGQLARTLLIAGKPLTQDERRKDEERMQKLVNSEEERAKRTKREKEDTDKAVQMLKAIPDAFVFKYAGEEAGLIRLSFFPNPHYDAPTRELQVFKSLSGSMWVDPAARHLSKIQGQLFEDVTFGWGFLARLNKGGTFSVVQKNVGDGHWDVTELDVNMTGHAILFKNIVARQREIKTDYHRVADDLTITQAYQLLEKNDAGTLQGGSHSVANSRTQSQIAAKKK